MAKYTVQSPDGKKITFEWQTKTPPTDTDIDSIISEAAKIQPKKEEIKQDNGVLGYVGDTISNIPGDTADIAKAIYGMVRHPIETAKGLGAVASGGVIHGLRKGIEALDPDYIKNKEITPEEQAFTGLAEQAGNAISDPLNTFRDKPVSSLMMISGITGAASKGATLANLGKTGAALESVGNITNPIAIAGKAVKGTTGLARKVSPKASLAEEVLGTTTGAGSGAIQTAKEGSKAFKDAMRGKTTGEDVVETAQTALQSIKEKRASDYKARLKEIEANGAQDIDMSPIYGKAKQLMDEYNIKVTQGPNGENIIDLSRSGLGKRGKKDIKNVINELMDWGTKPGDKSAIGLDLLKRSLDDFYSESSKARGFVASIRNEVKNTITKAVPEYAEMTKGYSEITGLIKDIESNLMLRKQGISGRITADQTLRRLTSALRENFEMRKDLLETLSAEGGKDLTGAVAGYALSQKLPRGLVGKMASGGIIGGAYALAPQFWPMLSLCSPRVVGEFMNVYGKAQRVVGALTKAKGIQVAGKIATNPKTAITGMAGVASNAFPDENQSKLSARMQEIRNKKYGGN